MRRLLSQMLLLSALAVASAGCPTVPPVETCGEGANADDTLCHQDLGYVCDPDSGFCVQGCDTAGDCLESEYCDLSSGKGMCRFGDLPGVGD